LPTRSTAPTDRGVRACAPRAKLSLVHFPQYFLFAYSIQLTHAVLRLQYLPVNEANYRCEDRLNRSLRLLLLPPSSLFSLLPFLSLSSSPPSFIFPFNTLSNSLCHLSFSAPYYIFLSSCCRSLPLLFYLLERLKQFSAINPCSSPHKEQVLKPSIHCPGSRTNRLYLT